MVDLWLVPPVKSPPSKAEMQWLARKGYCALFWHMSQRESFRAFVSRCMRATDGRGFTGMKLPRVLI